VWNAARVLSDLFEADPGHVRDKTVLELGAGAALPSIVAALNGAKCACKSSVFYIYRSIHLAVSLYLSYSPISPSLYLFIYLYPTPMAHSVDR
jgi:predicted nicotinamide N-methyase